ncbi:MAG: iron ABC transporter permease, partial [Chloroflexota bacterium]|nr:iron ABC transporter permease [Chloroflexota bacterium]
MLPFLLGAAGGCVLLGHQLNVLSLGEETAQSLGMRTGRTRLICSVLVVVITGAAVAIAGPIGFVGLAVPHMVRTFVGADYRWILPASFIYGAIFLVAADIVGRIVTRPAELEVGIVTALVGAPVMVFLARQKGGRPA